MSDTNPTGAGPAAMKPATAAKKLGIYLPAAPSSFRDHALTREQFAALQSEPPQWLVDLRLHGPHPRDVVARKLGVSASGLARAEVTEALTTDQILQLLAKPPEWLVRERATQAAVRAENARVNQSKASKPAADAAQA